MAFSQLIQHSAYSYILDQYSGGKEDRGSEGEELETGCQKKAAGKKEKKPSGKKSCEQGQDKK